MFDWLLAVDTCKFYLVFFAPIFYHVLTRPSYALAADIQTIPGLPTAPGYLNVDIDPTTGEIDGLF